MTLHASSPPDLLEPPVPEQRVLFVGLVGVSLALVAFVFGLATDAPRRGFDAHWADGPRALLASLGLLVAGCAVSMRPSWYGGWLCAAAAGLIGYGLGWPRPEGTDWHLAPPRNWFAGVPNSWDSVQLFFGVAGAIGLIGAVWTRLPSRTIKALILAWVAFHFAGIVSAITSPAPTPWLTNQYWNRVSKRYLQFAYMNNAYQFYSPDPGPACELWACVEYRPEGWTNDPDAPRECHWHYIPRRENHYVDPLGLSFYRRLSLTENMAQYQPPGYVPLAAEQTAVRARRAEAAREIPRMGFAEEVERRVPNEMVIRQLLPSFARHLATEYARPGWQVESVKIYRTLHVISTLPQFRGYDAMPYDPYMPSLYMPYFQGDFDTRGRLKDSTDPLLYWWVPIYNDRKLNTPLPATLEEYHRNLQRYGSSYYFNDAVARHAGCKRPTEGRRP